VIFESDGSSTEDEEIVDNLQILEILKFRLAVVCQKTIVNCSNFTMNKQIKTYNITFKA